MERRMKMSLTANLSVNTLKARYFAYNCLELKLLDGKTLVVDPCIEKGGYFDCGYDVDDLEGCDYVFLNHAHGDHAASLGRLYDRFHPLIMAHACTTFGLARLYDIPYIRFIPFTAGDEYDFDDFKLKVIHGRHNNIIPGNFMVRPSGRRDGLCSPPRKRSVEHSSELDKDLGDLGSMFGNNFLMTLKNNLRVGFFAGNPGMIDPQDRNIWKTLRPDIMFAHRAKFGSKDWAEKMAGILAVTGARILVPIHIEDAYSGAYDPAEYSAGVNKVCVERNIPGRMIIMERGQWYEFSTGVSKVERPLSL